MLESIAASHGGELLSDVTRLKVDSVLRWRCGNGHVWESQGRAVRNGAWCPICAGRRVSIEHLRAIAKERGGECLSPAYRGLGVKLRWRCAKGHEWDTTPNTIKKGSWCPTCRRRIGSIEKMRRIAEERGGKCLSDTYRNGRTALRWQCAHGHRWSAKPKDVDNHGTWCPRCAGSLAKGTIEEMQELARARGGECLSDVYVNCSTRLRWRCAHGHEWDANPSEIKAKHSWCPRCAGRAKYTIEEMQELARSRGGECLSDVYVDSKTKLHWRCAFGHEWDANPSDIKAKHSWCPRCAGKAKHTIEEMQELARTRGGECLSDVYVDNATKLRWRCARGHEWDAIPWSIKTRHSWCPRCAGMAKGTIEEMQELARARGGECLSDVYVNSKTNLHWRCTFGHEWDANPSHIKKHSWCPRCAGKAKHTIEEMQELARTRGGECLSDVYVNNRTNLRWRCSFGHEWESCNVVNKGYWCPVCAAERRCRALRHHRRGPAK
ncbi:MAG: zinc-ribbon domain-containing protein [Pseudomonadota bacterium]